MWNAHLLQVSNIRKHWKLAILDSKITDVVLYSWQLSENITGGGFSEPQCLMPG